MALKKCFTDIYDSTYNISCYLASFHLYQCIIITLIFAYSQNSAIFSIKPFFYLLFTIPKAELHLNTSMLKIIFPFIITQVSSRACSSMSFYMSF